MNVEPGYIRKTLPITSIFNLVQLYPSSEGIHPSFFLSYSIQETHSSILLCSLLVSVILISYYFNHFEAWDASFRSI